MQIDRYNHLLFPRDANTAGANNNNNPAATGKDSSSAAAAAGGSTLLAKPQAGVHTAADALANARPEGVVLKIQWPDGAIANNPDPGVYTNGGKLVSRLHSAALDKQPDFVALAVSAMREYSDEHERLRVRTTAEKSATTTPPEAHWGAFKGLQQIAAKLNVFA